MLHVSIQKWDKLIDWTLVVHKLWSSIYMGPISCNMWKLFPLADCVPDSCHKPMDVSWNEQSGPCHLVSYAQLANTKIFYIYYGRAQPPLPYGFGFRISSIFVILASPWSFPSPLRKTLLSMSVCQRNVLGPDGEWLLGLQFAGLYRSLDALLSWSTRSSTPMPLGPRHGPSLKHICM